MTISPYSLKHLSDTQLLDSLTRVSSRAGQVTALLLAHLAEVDTRRLYLAQGYSCLFDYCLDRLGCSEDEAAKRIQAARAARGCPVLFDKVAEGELHLSAINLLAPHLGGPHEAELIATASRKSKRQIEELLAARFPRPDVVASVRRLPGPRQMNATAARSVAAASGAGLAAVPPRPLTPSVSPISPASSALPSSAITPAPPCPPKSQSVVAPLSAERFKLQATVSRQARDMLQRAQALLRHSGPKAELGDVIERALALLCDELDHKKFGKLRNKGKAENATSAKLEAKRETGGDDGRKPFEPCSTRDPGTSSDHRSAFDARAGLSPDASGNNGSRAETRRQDAPAHVASQPQHATVPPMPILRTAPTLRIAPLNSSVSPAIFASANSSSSAAPLTNSDVISTLGGRSRYIPRPVRRAVAQRDESRCAYVSANGHRCNATRGLEFHHRQPFAKGGDATVDCLELRCRAHNDMQARLDFGETHMALAKQHRSSPGIHQAPSAPASPLA